MIGNVVHGIFSTFYLADTSPASESMPSSCLEPVIDKVAYVNLAAEEIALFIQDCLDKP